MNKVTAISSRKTDHIKINLEKDVQSTLSNGFENYSFIHQALPDLNLEEIETRTHLFDVELNTPLLISSMTGGSEQAAEINRNLAIAASEENIAMGIGSQRAAIEDTQVAYTFQIRRYAPNALLFANLGAIQLNNGYSLSDCQQAIDMIEANGLILHLNALQEALQPEGNTNFRGLLSKIENLCKSLPVPVIVKEVGWGISPQTAEHLINAGVKAIDVAGAGGTSWSQVEMHRAKNQEQAKLSSLFINWGIPTAEALDQIHSNFPDTILFASGGIRHGMDIAKSISLGASITGMAGPFLKTAVRSAEATIKLIHQIRKELIVTMFAVGAKDLATLRNIPIYKRRIYE